MTKREFVGHYFWLNRYSYLFAMVLILIVSWLQVEIPRHIQMAIDLLNESSPLAHTTLVGHVQWVIGFALLMTVLRILSRMYALNPGRITEAALKNDLFHRLNRLPTSFHQKFASGRLISIINNDLNGIRLFYGVGFLQLFNIVFALSLTPVWMYRISPVLTLYTAIPISIAFVIFFLGFRKMRVLHVQRLQRLQDLSEQLMNDLSGIDVIKAQNMGEWVQQKTQTINQRLLETTLKIAKIQTFVIPVLDYANHLMKVVILGFGGYMLLRSELSIGQITAFLSYSVLLALPLMHLGRIVTVFQMGMVSIDSVLSILNQDIPSRDTDSEAKPSPLSKGASLQVKNLNYRYAGATIDALSQVSFTLDFGKKLGILGEIGSGKSTLVNCLNHYLEVESGHIFWGDSDMATTPLSHWRKHIRTVTQDPYLFSDSISENVKFGASSRGFESDDSKIDKVLSLSQLGDDLSRFSQGKHTVVGEKGIMLSGGQKQRLSIARALLTPCDLLVFDNVLSAVDYETERQILSGMFERIQGQSVIVVSHRVSALEQMDEILVLKQGQIIARGTHTQLLATSDYYRQTWLLQQHETEVQSA
ncbi:ABC transporter ATP-binding protein [Alginatibacterium sediminis]|uniref:ABC transporter ATP-binding protein n=1 Tax=Alginatibacterium sediminis TaxID=2164068 RepID=A0A420EDU2_9ALTE|nr:ABC transporter ATP-binding protein [Alginatibacterium sediminis]RKF18867.1 ABC transporter ATP-binding protein [Alginatibacterium sediminis]